MDIIKRETPNNYIKSFLVILLILSLISSSIVLSSCSIETTTKRLIDDLNNESIEVQEEAIEKLTDIGRQAIPYLHESFNSCTTRMKKNIIIVLGEIRDSSSIELLIGSFSQEDIEIRSAAVEAIANYEQAAVDPLFKSLNSNEEIVRKNVLAAIEKIGVYNDNYWIQALENDNEDVQMVVILKLIDTDNEDVIRPLLNLLNSNNEEVILVAIVILGKFNNSDIVESLIDTLKHGSPKVVVKSIEVLSIIGDIKAVSPIINLLNSSEILIVDASINALGKFKDPSAVDGLIMALTNWSEEDSTRELLAYALINIGNPSVESLIDLLYSEKPIIRGTACYVLGEIGSVDAVEPLIERLNDEDYDVRFSAGEALNKIETNPEIESMIAAFENEDLNIAAKYYVYYILRGEPGTESILIKALNKYGNVTMAEDYLNCGNKLLEDAAETWAENNGYMVMPSFGDNDSPQWGSGK